MLNSLRKSRLIVVVVTSSLMLFSLPLSTFASSPAYTPEKQQFPDDSVVFFVQDSLGGVRGPRMATESLIFNSTAEESSRGLPPWGWCQSTFDVNCDFSKIPGGWSQVVFSKCSETPNNNCIKEVEFSQDGTTWESARFDGYLEGATMPADPRFDFPGGVTAGVWTTEENSHQGGTGTYVVAPSAILAFDSESKKFKVVDFTLEVIPFMYQQGPYSANRWLTEEEIAQNNPGGAGVIGLTEYKSLPAKYRPPQRQGNNAQNCFFPQNGKCLVQYDFASGVRIRTTLQLTNTIGGWFKGRLSDPKISVQRVSAATNQISVEAEPVTVPRFQHIANYLRLTDQESKLLDRWFWGGARPSTLFGGPSAEGDDVFEFVTDSRELVKDTVAGFTSSWSFTTTSAGSGSQCLEDTSKVLGIVTTNAMGFQGSAPVFDGSTLNYKVIGLHFKPDGVTPELGTYDLIMRSEVAQCLYGLKNAPISATVSITSAGQAEQVLSTTIINSQNGWLKLRADNFTFSEKNVRVKLFQESESTVGKNQLVEVSTKSKKSKKSSITCIKGSINKRVSAVKPKCPKGWKKSA